MGGKREGVRQREKNQQACFRVSQSGSERAPDSRVEREGECMCCQRERGEQLESSGETIEWE